ncbi:protein ALTERED XYLOGLUCAN 9-like [Curcuma longa]|uniref:protein ALTERED XYLOGLUCAN 9-like n=1 Tax=Curcuma longa TaxID=136217 RepID=UPI003D9E68E1
MMGPALAAQLGALAACIVLFLPLGMAGWHLSRNKVLFFSGALFISLAVVVHLAPHLPSLSLLLLSSLSPSIGTEGTSSSDSIPAASFSSCIPFLHDLAWHQESPSSSATWQWTPAAHAAGCDFQRVSRPDASDLLNGSWILVAGDSQARLLTLAFLRLLLDPVALPPVESDLFRRHSDYHASLADRGITLDFVWAPFEPNLTALLRSLRRRSPAARPDVIVLGSGLWHMLHFTNSSLFGESLTWLKRAAVALLSTAPAHPPHIFWLGLPMLVNSMLNTEEKRVRMNETVWDEYDQELGESTILRSDGGPCLLLDIGSLSQGCGRGCTTDGMHYDNVVYEAALHIMLNALLIESQQRI